MTWEATIVIVNLSLVSMFGEVSSPIARLDVEEVVRTYVNALNQEL